jgi:stage III sporulation protein AG
MSEEKNNKISLLIEKIKNNKKIQYLIIAICLIIAVMILVSGFVSKKKVDASFSIDSYVENLENRLSNVLSKVNGAGRVSVVITVESGMETVLASKVTTTENAQGKETEQSPIIVNGKTVVVKELYPKVIGVLIVAEGANNITVMSKIQQATISLLDININQIQILSM